MEPTQATPLLRRASSSRTMATIDKATDGKEYGTPLSSGSSISSLDKHDSKAHAKPVDDEDLQDDEPPPFRMTDIVFRRQQRLRDLDATATRRSVYDDPTLARHYWPKSDYENIHRFDPKARWTFREERDLIRKIDWRVMLWASFLAFGVLHMRGILDKAGWRGLITLAVGIATFFMMPPSPTQTKSWFRPNGWFNQREETIAVSRVLRDDPTKGDMHNREGLTPKRIWVAICDYDLWPLYIAGLMFGIPISPPATYLSLSLRNLGFDTFRTNLLSIPSSVAGMVTMFGITMISETVNDRSWVAMMEDLWALPFLVAIYSLPDKPNQWKFFGLASGLLSYPYTHPIQVAWCSRNSGAVASRTVNASVYNMFVQASSIIASQVYRKDDAPMYRRGNRIKAYYIWRNQQRSKIWDAMTSEVSALFEACISQIRSQPQSNVDKEAEEWLRSSRVTVMKEIEEGISASFQELARAADDPKTAPSWAVNPPKPWEIYPDVTHPYYLNAYIPMFQKELEKLLKECGFDASVSHSVWGETTGYHISIKFPSNSLV
ncbi:hypothetical protein H0H93_010751 [Arthromyces matolae]|nr:hypothetical protein H0H93_010751 [Arthromyces matolae]